MWLKMKGGSTVENLTINHYDCVEDIIEEALSTMCGIDTYNFEGLIPDVEYVCGCICIVKLGDKPNTLKHLDHKQEWSEDVEVSESYEYSVYYKKEDLDRIVKNNLTRKFYYNENFLLTGGY